MGRRQSPLCRTAPRSSSSPQKLRTNKTRSHLVRRQIAGENNSDEGRRGQAREGNIAPPVWRNLTEEWTAGELNPDYLGANQASYQVGPAAHLQISCGGRIRTGVVRLMRPSWNQAPVHSAVTKGRVELPRRLRHDVLSVACLPFHHLARIRS